MSDFVPLHSSKLVPQKLATTMKVINLPGRRRVAVGHMDPPLEGMAFRFESPEPDTERTVVLEFGLSQDASKALYDLLRDELP